MRQQLGGWDRPVLPLSLTVFASVGGVRGCYRGAASLRVAGVCSH